MEIFHKFVIVLIKISYIYTGNTCSIDLSKIMKMKEFFLITLFISNTFTDKITHPSGQSPIVKYSFYNNRRTIYNLYSEEIFKSVYATQESLVIFYIKYFHEMMPFIDFLKTQLTVKKISKCLIVYSSNNFKLHDEIYMIYVLKFAWRRKFLDFTILVTNPIEKTSAVDKLPFIYYYNPFDGVVHWKNPEAKDIDIFSDKLKNVHGHPFLIPKHDDPLKVMHVRCPNRELKVSTNRDFSIEFTLRILNFTTENVNAPQETIISKDYMEKWNVDVPRNYIRRTELETVFDTFVQRVQKSCGIRANNSCIFVL